MRQLTTIAIISLIFLVQACAITPKTTAENLGPMLATAVAQERQNLPKLINQRIALTSLNAEKDTVTYVYKYAYIDAVNVDKTSLGISISNENHSAICTNTELKPLILSGAKLKLRHIDMENEEITRVHIDRYSCLAWQRQHEIFSLNGIETIEDNANVFEFRGDAVALNDSDFLPNLAVKFFDDNDTLVDIRILRPDYYLESEWPSNKPLKANDVFKLHVRLEKPQVDYSQTALEFTLPKYEKDWLRYGLGYYSASCQNAIKQFVDAEYADTITQIDQCLDNYLIRRNDLNLFMNMKAFSEREIEKPELAINTQLALLTTASTDTAWDLINLGSFYRDAGRLLDSKNVLTHARSFSQVAVEEETDFALHYNLGWTLYELGNYDEAVRNFTLGLRKQPSFAHAYWRRAMAYEKLKEMEKVKHDLRNFIEIVQDNEVTDAQKAMLSRYNVARDSSEF